MARPRTPTNILEMRGRFKHDPQRRRDAEPVPSAGIGAPPQILSEDERAVWDEVVTICPPGVAGNSDRIALEMLARLLVEYRTNPQSFPSDRMRQLSSMLGRFGLTPSDRSKVIVPKGKGANPFESL